MNWSSCRDLRDRRGHRLLRSDILRIRDVEKCLSEFRGLGNSEDRFDLQTFERRERDGKEYLEVRMKFKIGT